MSLPIYYFYIGILILGISKEVKEVLLQNLRRDFPLEVAPVLLAPLIYSDNPDRPMDKINQDMSSISNSMVITIYYEFKIVYTIFNAYLCFSWTHH